jgi:NADH:ubiquinone oxidoreductase subunit 5 (subunit L)/multisubunit Na+/H+ antiporter MnhA subunit
MPVTSGRSWWPCWRFAACRPLAGFYSKDAILARRWNALPISLHGYALYALGTLVAVLTTFTCSDSFMWRSSRIPRSEAEHRRIAGVMIWPLLILGVASIWRLSHHQI